MTVTATDTGWVPTASPLRRPLRFATVGSVDDGKSTLIGRLLHDSKSIFEDQLEHVEAVSRRRGTDYVDLALLTDGLRAEREQGITIDVAYRYFSTPARDFVIADCPGHAQYTRNAITGASTADVAIVLVDARHGVVEQTRRHTVLMSLLRVPARRRRRQQDGPRRPRRGALRCDPRRVRRARRRPRRRRGDVHPGVGARRRQRRRSLGGDAVVRRPDAARPPRDGRPRGADRRRSGRGSRCSTSSARSAPSTATTAATPARSRRACCAPATTSCCCRPG